MRVPQRTDALGDLDAPTLPLADLAQVVIAVAWTLRRDERFDGHESVCCFANRFR
jgi:hypothetical protein